MQKEHTVRNLSKHVCKNVILPTVPKSIFLVGVFFCFVLVWVFLVMCSHWSLCSVSLVVTEVITESPTLHQGAECVLGHAFNASTVHNRLSHYLLLVQSLKARGENWSPLPVFPGPAYTPAHGHSLLEHWNIWIYQRFSWATYGQLIPKIFFLRFLTNLLFAPTGITDTGSCDVKQLLLIVFNRYPKNRTLPLAIFEPGQIKTSPINEPLVGSFQTSKQWQQSGARAFGEVPNLFLPLQWLLGYLFKATMEPGRGSGNKAS